VIRVHPDTRFFFTMNPVGTKGVSLLPEPLMSRLTFKVDLPSPDKETFLKVVRLKVPKAAAAAVKMAWDLCETIRGYATRDGAIISPATLYLRSAIDFVEACRFMSSWEAFQVTALSEWQDPLERETVANLAAPKLK
jgi:MoxR-like ATPase